MFEELARFSFSARRALALAQDEAQAMGHERLGTEHLLLALTRDSRSETARVFERLAISPERVQDEVVRVVAAGSHRVPGQLPLTPGLKHALELALRESLKSRETSVTTMHMLLALEGDPTSVASRVLVTLGIDSKSLRQQLEAVQIEADSSGRSYPTDSPDENPSEAVRRASARSRGSDIAAEPDGDTAPAHTAEIHSQDKQAVSPTTSGNQLRRRLGRFVMLVLLIQFLAFSVLTLTGWGSLSRREIAPPRMERIGAPPGLMDTYASLSHVTFQLEDAASRQIATAAFVGTPADWGGPEPTPPSLDVFGQSPGTTLHQLAAGSANTIMFVVPPSTVLRGPLYVVIKGNRYRLSLVIDESSLGFAVVTAAVDNHLLPAFASSLLWLTLPAPTSAPVALMLIRREPGAQAYELTHGTLGVSGQTGVIATPVGGVTLGTPVVAITSSTSALAGFLETAGPGPSRFVSTSAVANVLKALAPSVPGGS
jgi:hypothetical protein